MNDEYYMKLALRLAQKGRGYVSPNPMVGAIIVKKGEIIGKGYHHRYGGKHAEIDAIQNARGDLSGATLYVNMEPCCHEGKTPPCVLSIIEHKITRVVIGTIDSNPLVACRGINLLQKNGIDVKTGILESECRSLNEVFFYYMETGMPYITIKYAQTLDGRIATATGQSKWISSDKSRKFTHRLRAQHDAVLIGIKTVFNDDPELTVRLVHGRNPLRIIVDSDLKISQQAKVLQNLSQAKTIIATLKNEDDLKFKDIASTGAKIITCEADNCGRVDLKKLFKKLAEDEISSILIEGGAQIITSVLKNNLANRLVAVIAPKILGTGIEAVGNLNIKELGAAKNLSVNKVLRYKEDIIIDGQFLPRDKKSF
jgi:diaminohydroxyphosphoribosylaminopyrimidine deaminase / 5-amino-6-(5-phosphoribosylamino)uracil reductase